MRNGVAKYSDAILWLPLLHGRRIREAGGQVPRKFRVEGINLRFTYLLTYLLTNTDVSPKFLLVMLSHDIVI